MVPPILLCECQSSPDTEPVKSKPVNVCVVVPNRSAVPALDRQKKEATQRRKARMYKGIQKREKTERLAGILEGGQ